MTGRANKRPSLFIFVEARSFTDQHDLGMWIPLTGNRLCASLPKVAAFTYRDLRRYLLQSLFR
jgi:hypothetical protein